MDLINAVEKIVLRSVSKKEAKDFALTRFGELCAYRRSEAYKNLRQDEIEKKRIK